MEAPVHANDRTLNKGGQATPDLKCPPEHALASNSKWPPQKPPRAHEDLLMSNSDAKDMSESKDAELLLAALRGSLSKVTRLIQAGASPTARVWRTRSTALHIAAAAGNEGVAERLIDSGADLRAKDNVGAEPLHLAAFRAHTAIVSLLLKAKEEMGSEGLVEAETKKGETPLIAACKGGSGECVSLIANAKVSLLGGAHALHIACRHGKVASFFCHEFPFDGQAPNLLCTRSRLQ